MNFSLIPTAEASITTLVNNISRVIINPIIIFLFAAAIAYFIYGIAQYLMNPDNEEIRKKSKSQMVSGILGLFIMVAVFGIMNLIKNTIGAKDVVIQQSGVVDSSNGYFPKATGVGSMNLSECNTSRNIWDTYNNICTLNTGGGDGITGSGDGITGSENGDTGTGLNIAGNRFQSTTNTWYHYASYGPNSTGGINQSSGTSGSTFFNANDLSPSSRSNKNSILIGQYSSDSSYYRVVDSGVSPSLDEAKRIALNNALIEIAKLKGLTSTSDIVYRVLDQTEFPLDTLTGNRDSFIAVESPKTTTNGSSSY